MDADTLRARLRKFMDHRNLTVADWCRRAGIDAGSLYSFVRSRTNDLGATRLLALAAAEGVSMDEMLGVSPTERSAILDRVAPIIQTYGHDATIADVARALGMPTSVLRSEWASIDDLIVDTYVHVMADAAAVNFRQATDPKIMVRLHQVKAAAVEWSLPRLQFLVAFQSAILRTSPAKRDNQRALRRVAAERFQRIVIEPATDLLPMQKSMQVDLAQVLIDASIDTVRLNFDRPDNILPDFMTRASVIMAGKIVL